MRSSAFIFSKGSHSSPVGGSEQVVTDSHCVFPPYMSDIMQETTAKCSQQQLHNVTTRCLCSTRCHALMEVRGRSGRKTPLKELISWVGVGCVKHGSLCPSFTLPAARGASLTLCGLSVGECDVLLNYRKVRTAFHCIEIS